MPSTTDLERAATRRRKVLRLIRDSVATKGYPPSISELQHETGVSSTLTIRRDLDKLERDGKIQRDPGVTRGIRVL